MSAEDKEKVAQQYATRVAEGKEVPSSLTVSSTVSAASSVTSPSRAHIFVVTAHAQPLVLQSGAVAPLPINIYSEFPHVTLRFGPEDDDRFPLVRAAVDTCASVSTASYPFLRQIVDMYPDIVQCVYTTK